MQALATTERRPYEGGFSPNRGGKSSLTPDERSEVIDVMTRAGQGDSLALPRLRAILAADPERMVYLAGGDICQVAEMTILRSMYGDENLRGREGCEFRMRQMRADLAGPHPTAIERMLAERIVLTWLDCHRRDYQHEAAVNLTIAQSQHHDRLRERASRRYLAAIRALALIRKLDVTAIQVNVGAVAIGEPRPQPIGQ